MYGGFSASRVFAAWPAGDAVVEEDLRGQCLGLSEEGKQEVFGADEVVVACARDICCGFDHLVRPFCIAVEGRLGGPGVGEPFVRGLLAHTEHRADLDPRLPRAARPVHEEPERGITGAGQFADGGRRGRQLLELVVAAGVRANRGDQVLKIRPRSHASTQG